MEEDAERGANKSAAETGLGRYRVPDEVGRAGL
jgi:hypothetical protein